MPQAPKKSGMMNTSSAKKSETIEQRGVNVRENFNAAIKNRRLNSSAKTSSDYANAKGAMSDHKIATAGAKDNYGFNKENSRTALREFYEEATDIPKRLINSATGSKYAEGVQAIEVKKSKAVVPEATALPAKLAPIRMASSDPDNPNFIGPPTEAKMKIRKEDEALDAVAKEVMVPNTKVTSVNKAADMAKVKQHQEKLNKYGANLKVDGMWGAKTEAASRDLYPQYKAKAAVKSNKKAPVSDSKMQGLFGSSGKEAAVDKTTETAKASTPVKSAEVSNKPIPYANNTMSSFLAKSSTAKEIKTMQDDEKDTEARLAEKMVGDSDLHQPALNRAQAQKLVDLEDRESGKKKPNAESTGMLGDGTDKSISAAELTVPALARKMIGKGKGKFMNIAGMALSAAPTIADVVKGQMDSKEKGFDTGAAVKSLAKGVALGTTGSIVAGGVKRAVKGITSGMRETDAMNSVIEARLARSSAKGVRAKNAANALMSDAKVKVSNANALKTPTMKIGESFKEAANNTLAGKAVTAVKNNPISKAIRSRNKLKENIAARDENIKNAKAKNANDTHTQKLKGELDDEAKLRVKNNTPSGNDRMRMRNETVVTKAEERALRANKVSLEVEPKKAAAIAKAETRKTTATSIKEGKVDRKMKTKEYKRTDTSVESKPSKANERAKVVVENLKRGKIVSTEGASSVNPNYKSGSAIRSTMKGINKPVLLLNGPKPKTGGAVISTRSKATMKFKNKIKAGGGSGPPSIINDGNYKQSGYRKVITGGTFDYVKK